MDTQNNSKPLIAEDKKQDALKEKLESIRVDEQERKTENIARQYGWPYMNLEKFPIAPEALRLVSPQDSQKFNLICFFVDDFSAKIGALTPGSLEVKNFVHEKIALENNLKTEIFLISEISFNAAYKLYATLPQIKATTRGVEITAEEIKFFEEKITNFQDLNREIQHTSVSDLLVLMLASAVKARSSDIHIEAEEEEVKIRFRIDGILIDAATLDKNYWTKVVTRIKLVSGLKINVSDKPQDGNFTILLPGDRIDVRVSCLPTAYGESVVMRVLKSSAQKTTLEELGFSHEDFEAIKKQIERPNGLVITTGPTGSGKSTTLYGILTYLNDPQTKIITVEDPIEYRLKGINQSQVDPGSNYTFASGLRSILRQDPDVILVGEIRDAETAEIAVQASLTGHLVLSTLHTNDSFGAIPRFFSLGVKPYLLAPALNVVVGQRLVRKICPFCKTKVELTPEVLVRVKEKLGKRFPQAEVIFYKGSGCPKCQGLGYHGRIGIYEILQITEEIHKLISTGADVSEYQIKESALKQGMVTMVEDGLMKATQGITTVEEVFRVTE